MNEQLIKLAGQFSSLIEPLPAFRDECAWKVAKERLVELANALKHHADVPFAVLFDVTAVDQTPNNGTIEMIYHLYSHTIHGYVRLKVVLPADAATVPTLSHLWKSADWLEREVYDLFGVTFTDHPDLRRLLMPDDYDGYPLLKEHALCPQGDCDDF